MLDYRDPEQVSPIYISEIIQHQSQLFIHLLLKRSSLNCQLLMVLPLEKPGQLDWSYVLHILYWKCVLSSFRCTLQTMASLTDIVLMESTENTRKTLKRATMGPSSTPALMLTWDWVSHLFPWQEHLQKNCNGWRSWGWLAVVAILNWTDSKNQLVVVVQPGITLLRVLLKSILWLMRYFANWPTNEHIWAKLYTFCIWQWVINIFKFIVYHQASSVLEESCKFMKSDRVLLFLKNIFKLKISCSDWQLKILLNSLLILEQFCPK